MAEAWRSYLEMAYGLSKTSRKKAEKAVRELVGKSGAKAGELQTMAEDLMASADANRDALTKLVRSELDKALSRVGLVKAEEVEALQERVAELEAKLASTSSSVAASLVEAAPAAVAPVAAKKAAAKKTVAKKAPAKAAPAATKAAPAKETPAKAAPAKAGASTAAKAPAKKTVAKKAPAKKAPAKKAGQ
ncbi:MAG: hypothetical protein HOV79_24250 [Hamadaea sp.]|nr:hypothetical protein [Hamadaea sp.]